MSETKSGEELMGKRYGKTLNPSSDGNEDSYDILEESADDLEYEAKCKKITKRNQRAALAEQKSADASRKKTTRKKDVKEI
jgi:hypothetical protein